MQEGTREIERIGNQAFKRQIIETLLAGVLVTTTGEDHHKEAELDVVPDLGKPITATVSEPAGPA